MIRYDGYYIEEPTEVYDGRSIREKSSYSFNAYYFLDNKNLKISSKHKLLSNLLDFKEEDFVGDLSTKKKILVTEKKIAMSKSFSFENEVVFKIIDSKNIYNETFKKHMYFVSWSDVKELKINTFEDTLIYSLFGPFYHEKFKAFYQ
mgnify:CR=1 FL=1